MKDSTPSVPDADARLRRFRKTRAPEDFARLFDATSPALFRVAVRLTRDGAAAEDVLQETFLAILRGYGTWDPSRTAMPWMIGILERKAADAWRRRERDRRPLPRPEGDDADPRDEAEKEETRASIRDAIEDLDEPFRRVAVLRWRYGLEPGEIADALGENPGTVRSNLFRAKQRLERRLRPALLAPFLALPSLRGLDSVRAEVLSEAASLLAPAAASVAASAITTGGTLMAKKVLVTAVVVLALVGGASWLLTPGDRTTAPPAARPESGGQPVPAPRASLDEARDPRTHRAAPDDLPPPVDLDACHRDRDIFGTTVDDDGAPVPGAEVVAFRYPWRRSGLAPIGTSREEQEGPSTRSAIDGTFVLHFERGEQVDLRASADGYGPGDVTRCIAGERVRLVLRRGGPSIRVHCKDDAGRAGMDPAGHPHRGNSAARGRAARGTDHRRPGHRRHHRKSAARGPGRIELGHGPARHGGLRRAVRLSRMDRAGDLGPDGRGGGLRERDAEGPGGRRPRLRPGAGLLGRGSRDRRGGISRRGRSRERGRLLGGG
jgi:RNA polymerase sigma-70 factor (ECF subfamily)